VIIMTSSERSDGDHSVSYRAIFESHAKITDFRAKLLGFLPLASGAGGLILLTDERINRDYLTAVGLYGLAVTLGLFLYELRGIQTCIKLRKQAATLEHLMGVPAGCGQFRDREDARLGGLVGAEGASWTVYVAVSIGWLFVAGLGVNLWETVPAGLLVLLFAAILGVHLYTMNRHGP
jgi:hypothetical protein